MKDTKNRHENKKWFRYILCIALALMMAVSPVLPQINSISTVMADEAQGEEQQNITSDAALIGKTESSENSADLQNDASDDESKEETTQEAADDSQKTTTKDIDQDSADASKDGISEEVTTKEQTEKTTQEETSAEETTKADDSSKKTEAKNVLKADNDAQRKAQEEKKEELSPKLFATFTAKTDFEEGISGKIEVVEEETELDLLCESLNQKLQKENKEIKTVNLPLKMGFVNASENECEKNETVKVKLEAEDESVLEELKTLNDEGKLSLYHQKTNEDKTAKEWEKLTFKIVEKTEQAKAYIEFETESMSPFFFVQTQDKTQSAKLQANKALSNVNSAQVNSADRIFINDFKVRLSEGATKTGGKWVWTPSTDSEKNTFFYDVIYAVSGEFTLKKGEFKIEVPLHILKDRNGNWADTFDCPFVEESEYFEGLETNFVYVKDEENNKVTIYNINEIESEAGVGSLELSYTSTKSAHEYVDMQAQNGLNASLIIEQEDGTNVTKTITEDVLYIDTTATVKSVTKTSSNYYDTWQSSWGTKPSGADNYYYVVWRVTTNLDKNTQPYNIKITDTFSDMGGSVVGYCMSGASGYTGTNTGENRTDSSTDYVLTRFSKSQADAKYNSGSYTISNKVKVTVTPYDKKDSSTSVQASGSYTKTKPVEKKTIYTGINDSYTRLSVSGGTDYTLREFVDNEKQSIEPVSIDYNYYAFAGPYVWDSVMAYDQKEQDAIDGKFGHRCNEYTIWTPKLSLDYDLVSVSLDFYAEKTVYDSSDKRFSGEPVKEYQDSDVITVKDTTNKSTYEKTIAVYSLKTNSFLSIDESIVTDHDGLNLTFAEGVKSIRVDWSNPYYITQINVRNTYSIKRTDNTLNEIGNKDIYNLSVGCSAGGVGHYNSTNGYYTLKKVIPESSITKTVTQAKNDKIQQKYTVDWKINAKETYVNNDGLNYIPQESGVFYDLLPAGASLDKSSISITASTAYKTSSNRKGSSAGSVTKYETSALSYGQYTVELEDNYKDTGRTLMKIKITEPTEKDYTITYKTVHTHEVIQDYGKNLLNSVAFETGNAKISDGYADTGGKITESALLIGLDPDSSGNRFIYAESRHTAGVLISQYNGLRKRVKSEEDSNYVSETTAYAGGNYSYKIRSANNKLNQSTNMIFFDSLESYYQKETQTEETIKSDFTGTLKGVDVSQLVSMGADPVIYLSKIERLNVAAHHDLSETIDGEAVWIKYDEFVAKYGLEKARAVAVDARKASDGSDFVLDKSKGLNITISMTAPKTQDSASEDPCAYNNIFLQQDIIMTDGDIVETESQFIHQDKTTLHLRIVGDVSLKKVDETDGVTPVYGATYLLRGTSDYGTEYEETRVTAQNGSFSFLQLEKGTYELVETACSDDWLLDKNVYTVTIDKNGNVSVEGMEKNDDGQFLAQDAPRIHTDINFTKVDSITKNAFNAAEFILAGTSDYGNEIFMQAVSEGEDDAGAEAGEVLFENVELGTYTLSETKTKDGYILSQKTWTVEVTEDAFAVIRNDDGTEAERATDSDYMLPNEPLHSFRFVKSSTYGENIFLEGAKFSLTGISDYGTNTEKTAVSDADGIVTFNGLEPGTYSLKETEAPDKHDINKSVYEVTVKSDGSFEIEGLETTEISGVELYDFKDVKTEGVVKLTKIWKDDKTNDERQSPVLTISTKKPSKNPNGFTITFDANGGTFTSTSATSTTANDMVYSTSGTLISGTYIKPESEEGDFLNWTTEGGDEFELNEDGSPKTTLTEDVTVYANYQATGSMKYAVAIYGIEADTLEDGSTAGLTFGPAFGGRYATSYVSHTPAGTTSSGNAKRCVHNDSWSTIISWNKKDPYVYEDCIATGCTHAVVLSKNTTTTILSETFDGSQITGDGPSTLYYELVTNSGNCYENLRWHPNGGSYGTNSGGWGTTRIRAMLNGADSLTDTATDSYSSYASSDVNKSASVYTSTNCLLATFPKELRNAIGARAVKYDSVFNSRTEANLKISYDKLWLFSSNEMFSSYHPLEGTIYARYASGSVSKVPYYISSSAGGTSISSNWAWLRSSRSDYRSYALSVGDLGYLYYSDADDGRGVSVGFALKR